MAKDKKSRTTKEKNLADLIFGGDHFKTKISKPGRPSVEHRATTPKASQAGAKKKWAVQSKKKK